MGMSRPEARFARPPSEPIFRAPLTAVLTALSMPLLFMAQLGRSDYGLEYAFVPAELLGEGRWLGLFTSMLLHGGWSHVAMNALGALTFGAPVARVLKGGAGVAAFFFLYIVSGALAALAYALIHPQETAPLVGASGAVFGLIGAATRLIGTKGRRLRPLLDRRVLTMSAVWMAVNAATGLLGVAPGMEGATIAWEAHAAGFVVGILLIDPLWRLFGPTPVAPPPVSGDLPS